MNPELQSVLIHWAGEAVAVVGLVITAAYVNFLVQAREQQKRGK